MKQGSGLRPEPVFYKEKSDESDYGQSFNQA